MCTVILFHRVFDTHPLAVAANRDELLARPAEGFGVRDHVFSPVDLQHGGTWIGLNAQGMLVALTNRFGAPRDASRRSRGEIPRMALKAPDANTAAQLLLGVEPADFNPFHAVIADQRTARVVWSDGSALHSLILGPGVHVITERSFQSGVPARAARISRLIRALRWFDPHTLVHVLSDRHPGGVDAPFVDLPEFEYGTRSAMIAGLGAQNVFWESASRPQPDTFVDRTHDLDAFLRSETSLAVPS